VVVVKLAKKLAWVSRWTIKRRMSGCFFITNISG